MFGNLPLCVIKNPAGTFSFVGSIPVVLGSEIPASTAAVMGGRSFRNQVGELVELKFPVFPSRQAAVGFAQERGFEVAPEQMTPAQQKVVEALATVVAELNAASFERLPSGDLAFAQNGWTYVMKPDGEVRWTGV